jgi:hypothetical protein
VKPFIETLRVTNPVRQSRASSRKRVLRGGGQPSLRSVDSEIKRCVIEPRNFLVAEEDLHIHYRIWRSRGGPDTADNLELLHANCHRQIHAQGRLTEAAASARGVREGLSGMKGNCAPRNAVVESLTQSGGARRNAPESSD